MISDQNSFEYKKLDLKRGIDYIGVCCSFCCHDGNNNILLHKRGQGSRDEQGTWDWGTGSMEFGETFEETIRREMKEEYGATPLKIEYIGTRNVLRTQNEVQTHWIRNTYWVLVDPKEVYNNEPEKIDEIGWFALDNFPSPLHSQSPVEIEELKKFLSSRLS